MDIQLRVHLEPGEGTEWVWWADSEQLPGFTAAADHLPDLLAKAKDVIREEGLAAEDTKIVAVLVPLEHPSEAGVLNEAPLDRSLDTRGPEQRQAISTRTLLPA